MILLPFNTDAPIYHRPIATASLIAINIVVFFLTTFQMFIGRAQPESLEWLILQFDTINPLQWITAAFMHGDLFHLLGNMFFLWAFGLVVEGKIGSLRFVALYFLIALIDGAVVQIPMFALGSDSGALGASGVIFALMAIAVIWAPENELDFFYWLFLFLVGTFEARIISAAVAFLFLQLVALWLSGFSMSSELLHLIGIAIGAPIGFLFLRRGWVDCEGWDIVSRNEWMADWPLLCSPEQKRRIKSNDHEIVDPIGTALAMGPAPAAPVGVATGVVAVAPDRAMPVPIDRPAKPPGNGWKTKTKKRRGGRLRAKLGAGKDLPPEPSPAEAAQAHPEFNRLTFVLRQSIDADNFPAAQSTYLRLEQLGLSAGLGVGTLMKYVSLLAGHGHPVDTLRPLKLVIDRGGETADSARLRLALVQFRVLKKPAAALQTLADISTEAGDVVRQKRDRMRASIRAGQGLS